MQGEIDCNILQRLGQRGKAEIVGLKRDNLFGLLFQKVMNCLFLGLKRLLLMSPPRMLSQLRKLIVQ